ncbi:MAG: hypothetical protein JNM47_07170 [Hyphomonadaceae bacterium]|nr:hypothetical protein [Hyphomonadaceae bacterium]
MRLWGWVLLGLLVPVTAVALVLLARKPDGSPLAPSLYWGVCQTNDEISAGTRLKIESAAQGFLDLIVRTPLEARSEMSEAGKSVASDPAQFEILAASYLSNPALGPPRATETYLLRIVGGVEDGERVPCDPIDGRAVFVSPGGTPMSAVVILIEDLPGASQRATAVWLELEGKEWRVRALSPSWSQLGGRNSRQLWDDAQRERKRGHDFNAALLYGAARGTLWRGPFYQARLAQDFNADLQSFVAPELVRGAPPFKWTFGPDDYQVTKVEYSMVGDGGKVLFIQHTLATWSDERAAELVNRRLIDSFVAAYPEWREEFDAVAARAVKEGGSQNWGTVFEKVGGYTKSLAPPPSGPAAPPP